MSSKCKNLEKSLWAKDRIKDVWDLEALRGHSIETRSDSVLITAGAQQHFHKSLPVNTAHCAILKNRIKLYHSKKLLPCGNYGHGSWCKQEPVCFCATVRANSFSERWGFKNVETPPNRAQIRQYKKAIRHMSAYSYIIIIQRLVVFS